MIVRISVELLDSTYGKIHWPLLGRLNQQINKETIPSWLLQIKSNTAYFWWNDSHKNTYMDKFYIDKVHWKRNPNKLSKTCYEAESLESRRAYDTIAWYQTREEDCEPLHVVSTMPSLEVCICTKESYDIYRRKMNWR